MVDGDCVSACSVCTAKGEQLVQLVQCIPSAPPPSPLSLREQPGHPGWVRLSSPVVRHLAAGAASHLITRCCYRCWCCIRRPPCSSSRRHHRGIAWHPSSPSPPPSYPSHCNLHKPPSHQAEDGTKAALKVPRWYPRALPLANGRVAILGGRTLWYAPSRIARPAPVPGGEMQPQVAVEVGVGRQTGRAAACPMADGDPHGRRQRPRAGAPHSPAPVHPLQRGVPCWEWCDVWQERRVYLAGGLADWRARGCMGAWWDGRKAASCPTSVRALFPSLPRSRGTCLSPLQSSTHTSGTPSTPLPHTAVAGAAP